MNIPEGVITAVLRGKPPLAIITTSSTLASTRNGIDPLKPMEPERGRPMEVCVLRANVLTSREREATSLTATFSTWPLEKEARKRYKSLPEARLSLMERRRLAQPGVKMKLTSMSFSVTRAWASANLLSSLAGASVNTNIDDRGRLSCSACTMAPSAGSLQSLAPVVLRVPTAVTNSVAFCVTKTVPGPASNEQWIGCK